MRARRTHAQLRVSARYEARPGRHPPAEASYACAKAPAPGSSADADRNGCLSLCLPALPPPTIFANFLSAFLSNLSSPVSLGLISR
mmetsp:Transcript_16025/g.45883  ORF Transcript_16025/g.45883 Transcript_16025/m.45883 type:complete len:86 (+) Transcript_16025:43-300(+)